MSSFVPGMVPLYTNEKLTAMERAVCTLLETYAADTHAKSELAPHIARESLKMHHLYEDLGFESRTQMGKFMQQHFPALAALKPKDTLWKKFLYDSIGEVAPACAPCSDQATCFKCRVEEGSL